MITITEPKIAGLTPRWADFPGFSMLFDNPGNPFRGEGAFETLECDLSGDFFRRLDEGFRSLDPDRLLQTYLLCRLPPASYHVTAFDAVNAHDLDRCPHDKATTVRALMAKVPARTWSEDDPWLAPAVQSPFGKTDWNIRFGYDELTTGSGNALFVRLKPAGEESERSLDLFRNARAELSRLYRSEFGVGAGERYTAHVSLGYFANRESSEVAKGWIAAWDAVLREHVGEAVLAFRTASLYAFTSMANFYRASPLVFAVAVTAMPVALAALTPAVPTVVARGVVG